MSFIPLVRFLGQSGLIQELAACLRSQRRANLQGAGRIAKGLIASALAQQEGRSLLVITATLEEAGRWTAQLEGMGWETVQLYPTSEASPYEPFDLEPELVWDYLQAIVNPFMVNSFLHMFFATLETSLFVIGGISAWYILKRRHSEFFSRSLKVVLAMALVVAPLQVFVGHLSAEQVYRYQPAKLAAMEAQWETIPAGERADWSLLAVPNDREERNEWEVKIPGALGYLLEFKPRLDRPIQGLKSWDPQNRPHMVGLIYYSFRTMVAIGLFLAGLVGVTLVQWLRGKLSVEALSQQKWLMRAWIFAAPLGYIAVETGWIVRCVGRQPWIVYGQLRTVESVSPLPAGEVLFSLIGLTILYTVFFVAALYFGSRIIREGPNLELPAPVPATQPVIVVEPARHEPDRRPAEAR
jgi:cytochrome d ubiquinol oxidase subunit I